MSVGVDALSTFQKTSRNFLPTHLVSLEGERRWLMEEEKITKSHQQKATYALLKVKPI